MNSKRIVLALLALSAEALPASGQEIRNYDVNFTTNTIIADGVVSAGEWTGAAPAAGDWRELGQDFSDVDLDNNRFSILYDANNLYILYETDYDLEFLPNSGGNPSITFGEENLTIFIDPNRDGDLNTDIDGNPLEPGAADGQNTDGYQFSFNQFEGTHTSTDSDRNGIGFFTEAHVNAAFGDQANWNQGGASVAGAALSGSGIVVGQTNRNNRNVPAFSAPTAYGIAEIVIPFADLDADAMIAARSPHEDIMIPTGLNATDNGSQVGPSSGRSLGIQHGNDHPRH